MAEPHVVAGLKDKRSELSGIIADLERRINQHRADLLHVDAVLRLFAPDIEPETIRPKTVRRRNEWFRPGELARMVLDILRLAPAPLSIKDITVQVMQRRQIDPHDARTAERLRKLVNNALKRQAADRVERLEEGLSVMWRVRD
jgi:hypothetical protein